MKKISTSISLKFLLFIAVTFVTTKALLAQDENVLPEDSLELKLNQDAVYDRPFLESSKTPIAIGGYMEMNANYLVTDGISEGFNFQMQRLTLFFSSTIKQRIKFLSEIEFVKRIFAASSRVNTVRAAQ